MRVNASICLSGDCACDYSGLRVRINMSASLRASARDFVNIGELLVFC